MYRHKAKTDEHVAIMWLKNSIPLLKVANCNDKSQLNSLRIMIYMFGCIANIKNLKKSIVLFITLHEKKLL